VIPAGRKQRVIPVLNAVAIDHAVEPVSTGSGFFIDSKRRNQMSDHVGSPIDIQVSVWAPLRLSEKDRLTQRRQGAKESDAFYRGPEGESHFTGSGLKK
jgi:hypothetical protein